MNVQNRKCIRRLSFKSLWASRKRNMIAVTAIVLTTLLFTSLFTIVFSLNSSYETYMFRQIGGYCHGTYKEVNEEQIAAIKNHSKIKAVGERMVVGTCTSGVFGKVPAEVSYMDSNNTKWSYCIPSVGREPEGENEIAMDTRALELLGIEPKLGEKIKLTFDVGDKTQTIPPRTDTFKLVGYWEYDDISPVHFLNISKQYAELVEKDAVSEGYHPFRVDLNIMLGSSADIRGTMEEIAKDLGYQCENEEKDNCIRIGVNWGYTSSQLASDFDIGTVVAIIAFAILVIFTGYLIIYNIFQISVTGDIRFYGLLKTIGVTPRQLRRIIYHQALLLCIVGIPIGLLGGYGVGAILTPYVLERTTIKLSEATISNSPMIFTGSTLFSLITVLLSCAYPGRLAAKVSPIEATKYTEAIGTKKKSRSTRGAKIHQMAFANLGRNKRKTVLVVVSLSLSVVLLTILYSFVGGFDMEKYLDNQTCADFIVGKTGYFRFEGVNSSVHLDDSIVEEIKKNTKQTVSGCGYAVEGYTPQCWMDENIYREQLSDFIQGEELDQNMKNMPHRKNLVRSDLLVEGLDKELFEKLDVVDGKLEPLFEKDSHKIAICVRTDDYGKVDNLASYPKVGDTLPVTYVDKYSHIDTRTGKESDDTTPEEFIDSKIEKSHDVDYTVCALVVLPYSMSFRFGGLGYDAVLPTEKLRTDSKLNIFTEFYLFDTPDEQAEMEAENYLAKLTEGDSSEIMYESKKLKREDFQSFQQMFLLLGGLLCFIIGLVGILNFFNAIMTGIFSRRHEFAVLQSIGLTSKQLKKMLIYEGMFYTVGAVIVSLFLSFIIGPLAGNLMEKMFWFFTYRFTLVPVILVAPVFAILGCIIPAILYRSAAKQSVVERLREVE